MDSIVVSKFLANYFCSCNAFNGCPLEKTAQEILSGISLYDVNLSAKLELELHAVKYHCWFKKLN